MFDTVNVIQTIHIITYKECPSLREETSLLLVGIGLGSLLLCFTSTLHHQV